MEGGGDGGGGAAHRDPVDVYIPVEGSTEVVIPVLVRAGSGNDAWTFR